MANLKPLFEFTSIAVVGASESGYGATAWKALQDVGFAGRYYPINLRRDQVHGVKAYPSLLDVPHEVEAALIAVPRQFVVQALEDCAAKGVRAAVIVSGGFAEADEEGRQLQDRLSALAREHDVAVVGPNCFGSASLIHRTAAFGGSGLDESRPGNVAVISNSGGLLNEVVSYGNARGIGFTHLLASGNEAGVTAADALDYYVRDPSTQVILGLLETVRDPALFVAAAERAAAARKPIVLLKLGVSEKGVRSAATHTGALAGNEAVYDALFRQKGIIRVHDVDELIEMGALLGGAVKVLPRRPLERVAIVEISGGGSELLCDTAAAAGVPLPELSPTTAEALRGAMGERATPANPLDTGGSWGEQRMAELFPFTLRTLAVQDDVDVILSRFTLPRRGSLGSIDERTRELLAVRAEHPDRLFAVLSRTSDQFSEEWLRILRATDLTFVQGYGGGLRALGRLGWYSRYVNAPRDARPPRILNVDVPAGQLNEVQAKDALRGAGLPVVDTVWAGTVEEALTAADRSGYPVAAKVISRDIVHKSDAGGVKLGLAGADAVRVAFEELTTLPGFQGVAIQPMATPGIAEVVLGAHRDPIFGPVIMFGLGGIFVETLHDVALRVAPLSQADAESMLDDIKAAAILKGARGRPAADRGAIVRALLALSDLMLSQPRIASIDCNPAFAYEDGLLVVDARMLVE